MLLLLDVVLPPKSCGPIPLTARLIRISSKSLWSSMAATSQRYSAVSDRVVLKIRMLAGSLSWALFSKSPSEGENKSLYNCSFTNTARLHGPEKQNSLPSSSEVLFIRLSSESWIISLKFSGLAGWCSLFKKKKKKGVSKQFTWYLVLKVHITGDAVLNLFPLNPRVVCRDGLY